MPKRRRGQDRRRDDDHRDGVADGQVLAEAVVANDGESDDGRAASEVLAEARRERKSIFARRNESNFKSIELPKGASRYDVRIGRGRRVMEKQT